MSLNSDPPVEPSTPDLNEKDSVRPAPEPKPSRPSAATRRGIPGALVAIVVVIVAGAAIGGTAIYYQLHPVKNATTVQAPSKGKQGAGNVTVVDDEGRTVTAPADASRVVVLAPSIMDVVYRLGLRSSVVAVGCTPSLPGGIYDEYSPNQTALWGLSNSTCITDYPTLNTEGVALAEPQLVLAATITSEADINTLTSTYNLPVVILTPSTLEGIIGDVRIMAQLFPEAQNQSTALEAQLAHVISNVTAEDANLTNDQVPVQSVLLSYYFDSGGYYTYGPGTFGASLIDLAGGSNIAGSVPLSYDEMNATVVLNDQPQVVLYGTSWNDPDLVAGETPSVWPTAPYWSQLTGTKVAVEIELLSEPDPAMILALPWIQHVLYPTEVPAP